MQAEVEVPPRCPRSLLVGTYFLYLGLTSSASVPLFGNVDWLHEGERLGTAEILLHGGLPFRDVYLPHGLLPEVIRPLVAFWLFGESLAADRLVGVFLAPLAYVACAFYVWKLFPSRGWRIAALLAVALYPVQLIPRHILVFLTLGFLAAWTYARRPRDLVLAGTMVGLSTVGSTLDQVAFLFATTLAFTVYWIVEQFILSRMPFSNGSPQPVSIMSLVHQICPLVIGMWLGLVPFLGYLVWTGTGLAFLNDYATRVLTDAVVKHDPFPEPTLMNITWYAVPTFYGLAIFMILVRVFRFGDCHWAPVVPTLLFGAFSFSYVLRGCCPSYGKLAVVSFPVVVLLVYLLYVIQDKRRSSPALSVRERLSRLDAVVLVCTGLLAALVLLHALVRDWNPKQIAPRFVFPLASVAILAGAGSVRAGRFRSRIWQDRILVSSALASVIVATWFYNDAKPQVLTAQIQKPKLVKQIGQLVGWIAASGGRLTRDSPPYVRDEVLDYLKSASQNGRDVIVLATGSGLYYFLADVNPPNRFPEIYHAMADGPAQEVVEAADRLRVEFLIACGDRGQAVTGWPINPQLARFIAEKYTDSGRRLSSQRLGDGCPFSVWVHRDGARDSPAEERT
ncbi:MAG: hypothetical protein AB1411_10635 [Nitrospirota bacterium]